MKSTGIVRRVDQLGRVVIPKELRRTLGIAEKDGLEIFMDSEKLFCRNMSLPVFSVGVLITLNTIRGRWSV